MLGSIAKEEDVVQDAFIRWHQTDRAEVREPESFLVRMEARPCLDVLISARMKRGQCIGTWLPESVFGPAKDNSDNITLTLMTALERLSPLERSAFLQHDIFGGRIENTVRSPEASNIPKHMRPLSPCGIVYCHNTKKMRPKAANIATTSNTTSTGIFTTIPFETISECIFKELQYA